MFSVATPRIKTPVSRVGRSRAAGAPNRPIAMRRNGRASASEGRNNQLQNDPKSFNLVDVLGHSPQEHDNLLKNFANEVKKLSPPSISKEDRTQEAVKAIISTLIVAAVGHGAGTQNVVLGGVALGFAEAMAWLKVVHPAAHGAFTEEGAPGIFSDKEKLLQWVEGALDHWVKAWGKRHPSHHQYTESKNDPDRIEPLFEGIKAAPEALRPFLVLLVGANWIVPYQLMAASYGHAVAKTQNGHVPPRMMRQSTGEVLDFILRTPEGNKVLGEVGFTALRRFLLMPLLAAAATGTLRRGGFSNAFTSEVLGYWVSGLLTFYAIATNHCGSNVYEIEGNPATKAEWLAAQALSSVTFRGGGALGWLTFDAAMSMANQTVHHLNPRLTPKQQQEYYELYKAKFEEYGIIFPVNSIWDQIGKMNDMLTGKEKQQKIRFDEKRF